MKTFNCEICGKEVSKRQSLAYKDGRACRHHEDVLAESQDRIEAERAKKLDEIRQEQQKKERASRPYHNHVPSGPECWSCHKSGIHKSEHWLRMAVAVEKCQLKGESLLDGEAMRNAYGEPQRVLVLMPVPENIPLLTKHDDIRMLWQMSAKHLLLCAECAKRNKLFKQWEEAFAPQLASNLLEDWMRVAATSLVAEVTRKVAKMEVAIESSSAVAVFGEKELNPET